MKRLLPALALLLLICVIYLWRTRTTPVELAPADGSGASAQSRIIDHRSKIPLELTNLAVDLNSPTHDIAADLRIVATMLDTYRSNFPRDGNPVGNNREITATLAGDNRLRVAFIPQNHPAISHEGELCDRWGTPFFFHAESGTQMEVRSAGPDRKMFTADDALFGP